VCHVWSSEATNRAGISRLVVASAERYRRVHRSGHDNYTWIGRIKVCCGLPRSRVGSSGSTRNFVKSFVLLHHHLHFPALLFMFHLSPCSRKLGSPSSFPPRFLPSFFWLLFFSLACKMKSALSSGSTVEVFIDRLWSRLCI
jgi:hypothetical protein